MRTTLKLRRLILCFAAASTVFYAETVLAHGGADSILRTVLHIKDCGFTGTAACLSPCRYIRPNFDNPDAKGRGSVWEFG